MISFLKYKWFAAAISASLLVVFIIGYLVWGGFNYSVDFTGGTQVLLGFSSPIKVSDLESKLKEKGWGGVATREFSKTQILVRVKDVAKDVKGLSEKLRSDAESIYSGITVTIEQADSVGSGGGATLRSKALIAIILALLGLLIYIGLRFKFAFAVGAVVAVLHDAIAILAFFLIFNKELSINVIGAILCILGYSVNDTIVIFARIRENFAKMRGESLERIVDLSINQTLRRTILTSAATALVVLSLLFLGGETLRDLSYALLIGIVVGTYSSIYVASPIMLLLYKGEGQ